MESPSSQAALRHDTTPRVSRPEGLTLQGAIAFLAEAALQCLDIYALYDLAVELMEDALAVEFVEVLQEQGPEEPLVIVAGCGWDDSVELGVTTVPSDRDSQAGYTLTTGDPVSVEDHAAEDRFEAPPLLTTHAVKSGITVLIPGEFKPYGVLGAHTITARHFTGDEGDFLRSMASILGGARENIRTRLEIERVAIAREHRLTYHAALAQCAEALLASDGGEQRIHRAGQSLLRATQATRVFVAQNVMDPEVGFASRTVSETSQPDATAANAGIASRRVVSWDRRPASRELLEAGKPVVLVPSELDGSEAKVYAQDLFDVASEIMVPIFVNEEWAGMIGLAECETVRAWSDEDNSLLTAAATMIAAFWERECARVALQDKIRSKDMYLAAVSHELRTPLTAVIGTSEILRDESVELSPDERAELLDMVVSEGTDLVSIVSDLLAAAKADSGTLTVSQVPVSLRAQVAQVLESMGQDPDVPIDLPDHSVMSVGDPDRVRQITRNLLTNAKRYGGDHIRIEFAHDGELSLLRVCDNGRGVPEEDRRRIFEAYESAHGIAGREGSVGLGLAISRRLARLMKGDLIYRHTGTESVFELILPRGD